MRLGCWLNCEEFAPAQLLEQAKLAGPGTAAPALSSGEGDHEP
jgi:hypothetical protein